MCPPSTDAMAPWGCSGRPSGRRGRRGAGWSSSPASPASARAPFAPASPPSSRSRARRWCGGAPGNSPMRLPTFRCGPCLRALAVALPGSGGDRLDEPAVFRLWEEVLARAGRGGDGGAGRLGGGGPARRRSRHDRSAHLPGPAPARAARAGAGHHPRPRRTPRRAQVAPAGAHAARGPRSAAGRADHRRGGGAGPGHHRPRAPPTSGRTPARADRAAIRSSWSSVPGRSRAPAGSTARSRTCRPACARWWSTGWRCCRTRPGTRSPAERCSGASSPPPRWPACRTRPRCGWWTRCCRRWRRGLLREPRPGQLAFSHALVGDAIRDSTPPLGTRAAAPARRAGAGRAGRLGRRADRARPARAGGRRRRPRRAGADAGPPGHRAARARGRLRSGPGPARAGRTRRAPPASCRRPARPSGCTSPGWRRRRASRRPRGGCARR